MTSNCTWTMYVLYAVQGYDQLWCLKDEVCGFETKKATKSVHCTNTCEKHTLTHTDVTSINYVAW